MEAYWMCMQREDRLLAMKYGMPDRDLDEFRFGYHIAIARREDAGLMSHEEANAAHRRVEEAVEAERQRRQAEVEAEATASERAARKERQAASLSALAAGLGAIVRNQPPPPQTTLYNFGGRAVTCTRWQNVVNCY
jgi:hypothetical protein